MSLQEALARNRAVFARLTGETALGERPPRPPMENVKKTRPEEEPRRISPLWNPDDNVHAQTPLPVFSLKTARPAMDFDYSGPAPAGYPEITEKKPSARQDPLEDLYYRIEVDARRASQLTGEEE